MVASNPGPGVEEARVTGVAVPFGQFSDLIGGLFREQFDPHAFDWQARDGWQFVEGRFQHEQSFMLATTRAGTMTLTVTPVALTYSMAVPAALPYVRELVERGDLAGASIGFEALETDWTRGADDVPIRIVTKARLAEVSLVGNPAYPQTTAAIASGPQRSFSPPGPQRPPSRSSPMMRHYETVMRIRQIENHVLRAEIDAIASGPQRSFSPPSRRSSPMMRRAEAVVRLRNHELQYLIADGRLRGLT
jgi:uncharacterized protein